MVFPCMYSHITYQAIKLQGQLIWRSTLYHITHDTLLCPVNQHMFYPLLAIYIFTPIMVLSITAAVCYVYDAHGYLCVHFHGK